ncbi:hypothetical protein TBLA_0A05420 [Henningerozyma blattae CBS 6284]|uniref:Topoisomerase 1-associated factor 1 n=1 Tax=Henningerozyma blattae (strain ATCC 34711 / CBS 6284 / DSM 70876 / NBRC 10599 / NRRL Y-10934 / UCD 77-7) TaxID=1071380 RepID=I2GW33_HENB6|nr:hypothetical protein TBLA_0A05420 [Tetrapisispora blattae CBS 6284]CCH58335.1 hypothetical protein TBLA_0A05420 [Tetrapisispora blattae CBS 6284]
MLPPVDDDIPKKVLRARIALLATAIGGPDYSSKLDPPPYKLGDDCLACLKDLKRWFKLVDDQQNRWDVALAAAEYQILMDDIIPILIDWEDKSRLASKLSKINKSTNGSIGNNDQTISISKIHHDKIALNCLQLLVLMTWPLVLNEQSTIEQILQYAELKKYQLLYKKMILSVEDGKVLRAVIRLAANVIRIDKLHRTARDNMILKLILNFLKNIASLEPGELAISPKMRSRIRNISNYDMLPPNVTMDDISLNSVITAFHKNKVFKLILTLSSSISREFDQDFINIPLLELLFYLTKNIDQIEIFKVSQHCRIPKSSSILANTDNSTMPVDAKNCSSAGFELSSLLNKERELKKNLINGTSSRHSRFGALLSIKTVDDKRLTVSVGGANLIDNSSALDKLDSKKKWKKRVSKNRDDELISGLPDHLLGTKNKVAYLYPENINFFVEFINMFIDTSFNPLLRSITNLFTTEEEKMNTLEKVEYLLFITWFLRYQRLRWSNDSKSTKLEYVSFASHETAYILTTTLLRSNFELKNWIVVHAGIMQFTELLLYLNIFRNEANESDIDYTLSRLFSNERLKLLTTFPKIAVKYSLEFMKSCINLTHTILKTLQYYDDERKLVIEKKTRSRSKKHNFTQEDIKRVMEEEDVGQDEALDMLLPSSSMKEVDFTRVRNSFMNESVIETFISFLKRFRELDDSDIKKALSFFSQVFFESKEDALLLRIDVIVLLREMLAPSGLRSNDKNRKYLDEFTKHYLHKFSQRLKSSPSWFVSILFPLLHDSSIGYYQRYNEMPSSKGVDTSIYGAPPSKFKKIEDEQMLSPSIVKDLKIGILVSTLIDDDKTEILDKLVDNMESYLSFQLSLAHAEDLNRDITDIDLEINKFTFSVGNESKLSPIVKDKDFRALLYLIGYVIPALYNDPCYIQSTLDHTEFQKSLDVIKKYMHEPFQTPNGKSSSSYLIRPRLNVDDKELSVFGADGLNIEGDSEYNSHLDKYEYDEDNDFIDDNDYFKGLSDTTTKSKLRSKSKGVATSKNKKKKTKKKYPGKELPRFDNDDDDNNDSQKATSKHQIVSKAYIDDSDDEDDNILNPIFFENEMYMRWLLDKNNGNLSKDKYEMFAAFVTERIQNNGKIISNYTSLFDGPVPNISLDSTDSNDGSSKPDDTLRFLSRKTEEILIEHSEGKDDDNDSEALSQADKRAVSINNISDTNISSDESSSTNENEQLADDFSNPTFTNLSDHGKNQTNDMQNSDNKKIDSSTDTFDDNDEYYNSVTKESADKDNDSDDEEYLSQEKSQN